MSSQYIVSLKPNIGGVSHDQSAALFRDGHLVRAAAEERFTRDKHAIGQFPSNAVRYCLDEEGITLEAVDVLAVADNPKGYLKRLPWSVRNSLFNTDGVIETVGSIRNTIVQGIFVRSMFPEHRIREGLSGFDYRDLPDLDFVGHHRSHAASAYYYSGFDDASVITVDGSGEYDSTVIWDVEGSELRRAETFKTPNSIGLMYGFVTRFLGYRMNNGETKIMGMAPYGDPNRSIRRGLERLVSYGGGTYDVTDLTDCANPEAKLSGELGMAPRSPGDPFEQHHRDLAYEVQRLTEELVVDLVEYNHERTGKRNVAVAGGVFLNCKMNKRIMESEVCEQLFVQPAAGDDGLAIGAGRVAAIRKGHASMDGEGGFFSPYLGSEADDSEVEEIISESKLASEHLDEEEVPERVARDIAGGKLVGHFHGRMEFGPRALGNRSILADPRTVESKDRVNEYVKHREPWRPFAPSILEEAAGEYLVDAEPAPYMIKTFDVKPDKVGEIEAVIHEGDDTTRPQTVRSDQNERYYEIIAAFEAITGVPAVLNTSFNDHGEPIVRTPREAVRDFFSMGLDVLYLEDYRLEKDRR